MTLYYPTTKNFVQKTLEAQLDSGTTASMTLNNVTGIQNKPGVCLLNRVNSSGTEQPAADREFVSFTGVSGSTLTGLTRNADGGSSDQDHAVGTVVEFVPDILWAQGLTDTLLVEHGTDGTHDNTTVALLAGAQEFTGAKTFGSGLLLATSPKITTGINDANGNEVIKTPATGSAVNELTVTNSATGNPVAVSATGGDDNISMQLTPKGTGVIKAKTTVQLTAFSPTTDTATGDGKAGFRVPAELAGMNLVKVAACVTTAGTTGTTDVQIRNATQTADMLTTKITIDSGETDTATAATAAVIDTNNDDIAEGDQIYVDVDAVSTTAAKGLMVHLTFATP